MTKQKRKTKRIFKSVVKLLDTQVTDSTIICDNFICETVSNKKVVKKLKRIAKRLYIISKRVKVKAIIQCNSKHDEDDNRKITIDYYRDLLKAIKKLPPERMVCE